MALIVEDGTGIATANTYALEAEADAYQALRGNTDWTGLTTAKKEVALIKATSHIETRWRSSFKGLREFSVQALSFPRVKLYDSEGNLITGVPVQIKEATYIYADVAAVTDLFIVPVTHESGLQVTSVREKTGPLEEETTFAIGSKVQTVKRISEADLLIGDFLLYRNRVIRA